MVHFKSSAMQLKLLRTIPAPLSKHLSFVYPLESKGAFLAADNKQVILLRADGAVEPVATLDGDPYQWTGMGAEYAAELALKRRDGFKMLSMKERKQLEQSEMYKSARDFPVAEYAHDGVLLFFSGKSVSLLEWDGDRLLEVQRTRTKGREPVRRALHPQRNLMLYGTNYGELYSQTFAYDRFIKSGKIDQLPNTIYQITFSEDGGRLYVAGLGFMRFYKLEGDRFTPVASIVTAARSFELVDNYIVLNKGMHGIDIMQMHGDEPKRIGSFDPPFNIDQLHYLAPQRVFLLTSSVTNEWALLKWQG